jgi:hypothetical protein
MEFLARAIRQEEEIKGIQIGKEVVNLTCKRHDLIPNRPKKFYLKTPRHHKQLQQGTSIQNQLKKKTKNKKQNQLKKFSSLSAHQH